MVLLLLYAMEHFIFLADHEQVIPWNGVMFLEPCHKLVPPAVKSHTQQCNAVMGTMYTVRGEMLLMQRLRTYLPCMGWCFTPSKKLPYQGSGPKLHSHHLKVNAKLHSGQAPKYYHTLYPESAKILPWILWKSEIIGGLCLKSQELCRSSALSLENLFLFCHLAKHSLTSNILNMECEKRRQLGC
jgi:hypothetical protein